MNLNLDSLNWFRISLFSGQPAGSMPTHSRTTHDEAVHGGPEWRDVLPESGAPGIPDCLADIATEGGDGVSTVKISNRRSGTGETDGGIRQT